MVLISPQQELFIAVKMKCIELGYTTYDYLPMVDVPYPFVYIGDGFSTDVANKTSVHGLYYQTIHIYSDTKKRGSTSTMVMNIKQALRETKQTDSFHISIRNITDEIKTDNSTNVPLLHGIIEVEFYFN